jgi:hypothetical protein
MVITGRAVTTAAITVVAAARPARSWVEPLALSLAE